ncbi:MAG: hypothetical protein J5662_04585, partial [Clostridia bacterium]|nr:hypothetical protein [Clostridia bacterium]
MFSSKTAGNLYKTAKIVTCAVLAVCIVSSMLLTLPFITAADTELKENTTAAIFIGKANQNRIANAFIPVDIADGSGNLYSGKTYFKLEFKCKMLSGTKPIIGVMRVKNDSEEGTNKTFSEPSWCDNASDVTVENGICTAYFSVDFNGRYDNSSRGNRSFYITVGNAEHDGGSASEKDYGVSFIMSDATLVTCDSAHNVADSKNRLPEFTPENIDFSGTYFLRENGGTQYDNPAYARAMVWGVDSSPHLVKKVVVPIGYNTIADYDSANFTLHAATDTLREYYTNDKYSGMYFEKLANSDDKGFAVISDDLNKKFVFINANHKGEEDNTTVDGYKPQYNKVGNIFIPLSLGQYFINEGALTNQKVLVKVTFNAVRIEGDGPPVLGRVLGKSGAANGMDSWAWGLSTINARSSAYYTSYNRSDNGGGVRPQCTYNAETGEFVGWVGFETANYSTLFGTSEVLTIGNAEHVYQEGTFDSTSFNSAFAISDIKVDLYSTTISGNNISPNTLIAEDITPALTADSIDTEGDWYFNYKNGASNHDKDLIRASQNVWHIDGEKSLVSFVNTEDKGGYARKYSVTESGATGTLSTYIKLDAGKTYQYIFKNKYESGERAKPFVEFITASGTEKLSTGNYNTNINGYNNTVFAFKTPADLNADKNVRIGIEFPSAAVSGTFGGFELYEIGDDGMAKTDKNLMLTVFIGENEVISPYSPDAQKGVWMKEGTLQEGGTTFEITYKEDNYYLLSSAPKMLFFAGSQGEPDTPDAQYKGGDGKLKQSATIEKNTKYRFTANVKFIDTSVEGDTVGFKLVPYNTHGGERPLEDYTDLSDENKYLLRYEFTSPKSLLSGKSFTATFNVPNSY